MLVSPSVAQRRYGPPAYTAAAASAPSAPIPSTRANAYVASVAMTTCAATMALKAEIGGKNAKLIMAGRYAQPDSGSPANGVPENKYGFQPGTLPLRRTFPRWAYQGRKKLGISKSTQSHASKVTRFQMASPTKMVSAVSARR